MSSGVGTNLKVGGAHVPRFCAGKFLSCLPHFASTNTISRFGERYRDGQYTVDWSVSCLLFFDSRCTLVQPFVKVGGQVLESSPMFVRKKNVILICNSGHKNTLHCGTRCPHAGQREGQA